MGGVVSASFEGLDELARLAQEQQRHVDAVRKHVEGACGRVGAFTGLMSLFAGAYAEAHATVVSELGRAGKGAGHVSTAFRTVVATYRHHDRRASERMQTLHARISEAKGYAPQEGEDGFGVPRPLKFAAGATDYADGVADSYAELAPRLGELPAPGPLDVGSDLKGLPSDGVGLVADFTDTIGEGLTMSDASSDSADYEEFEHEHAGGHQ
ncbi:hypothetical protein [Oryzihumus sp.]